MISIHHGRLLETLIQKSLDQVLLNLTKDTEKVVRLDHLNPGDFTYSNRDSDYQLNCLPRLQTQLGKSPTCVCLSLEQLAEIVRDQILLFDQEHLNNDHDQDQDQDQDQDHDHDQMIETITFSKQFLNISLKPSYILKLCGFTPFTSTDPDAGPPKAREKILVDYSGPNIAKSLHNGHLRSTIIGEALVNILKLAGHDVTGVNHLGDWGTQFGMLLAHLKTTTDAETDTKTTVAGADAILAKLEYIDSLGLTELYRQAKSKFDADPEFAKDARHQTSLLQQNDETNLKIWKQICEISRRDYQRIYQMLNIKNLVERGESSYGPLIPRSLIYWIKLA